MEDPTPWRYINFLTGQYPSIASIWLLGSRANDCGKHESDWDLLVFADGASFAAMQSDPDVHATEIDLMVVIDGDRFEQPWVDDGYKTAKFGFLSNGWRWNPVSETEATYFSTRHQQVLRATRLWSRE